MGGRCWAPPGDLIPIVRKIRHAVRDRDPKAIPIMLDRTSADDVEAADYIFGIPVDRWDSFDSDLELFTRQLQFAVDRGAQLITIDQARTNEWAYEKAVRLAKEKAMGRR